MGFVAPAIGAISGGASILGGLFGGGKSKQEKQLMGEQLRIAKEQEKRAQQQFETGQKYLPGFEQGQQQAIAGLGKAGQTLDQVMPFFKKTGGDYDFGRDYYKRIASGGEAALDALLGPQRAALNRATDAEKRNILQRGPRGGGTNQQLAQIDQTRLGRMIDMTLAARPQAVEGLLGVGDRTMGLGQAVQGLGAQQQGLAQGYQSIAQDYGNLALGYTGQGTTGLSQGSSSIASLLGSEQNSAARRSGSQAAAGQGLGSLFLAIGKKQGWF